MRRWLARLVDAEVRQLKAERDEAWSIAGRATKAASGWHAAAQVEKARADALAATRKKESTTR
ncbi:hypothetical protein [Micromonospora sp. NPDC005324]|uniref:hypothetical protein n=1 Tax=Micromonospora sp. NPDC005324 TaxID=3157033 RepID=UPI0033A3D2E6